MESIRIVNGWKFEWDENNEFYQCRGDIYYDDEHDEVPEPSLWKAALELAEQLRAEDYNSAEAEHSEKGWVEVTI